MVSVWNYCEDGGPLPPMLDLAWKIEAWGVEAILARPWLSAKEIRHMTVALNVYNAHKSRDRYRDKNGQVNWSEWAGLYKRDANILSWAAEIANE